MLTMFHNQQFNDKIDSLPNTSAENKLKLKEQASDYMVTLFNTAQFDPE